jgi:YtkA-like
MQIKPAHLLPACVAAVAGLLSLLLVLSLSASGKPGAALSELGRAATPVSVHPTLATFVIARGPYRAQVSVSPNIAASPNQLVVRLMRRGRPVSGARIRVVFSMPAMNMWGGFTSRLASHAGGLYVRQEPVLGMAGVWQLRVDVTGRAAHFSAVVNDRMRG